MSGEREKKYSMLFPNERYLPESEPRQNMHFTSACACAHTHRGKNISTRFFAEEHKQKKEKKERGSERERGREK